METASIAHVCYVNKIPFLSIRCITDTAEHKGVENFEKNFAAYCGTKFAVSCANGLDAQNDMAVVSPFFTPITYIDVQ